MKSTFNLLNTDQIEAEMTIKMTFYEWKKVRDLLHNGSSCSQYQLAYRIRDMINAAEQVFDAKDQPTKTDVDNESE